MFLLLFISVGRLILNDYIIILFWSNFTTAALAYPLEIIIIKVAIFYWQSQYHTANHAAIRLMVSEYCFYFYSVHPGCRRSTDQYFVTSIIARPRTENRIMIVGRGILCAFSLSTIVVSRLNNHPGRSV